MKREESKQMTNIKAADEEDRHSVESLPELKVLQVSNRARLSPLHQAIWAGNESSVIDILEKSSDKGIQTYQEAAPQKHLNSSYIAQMKQRSIPAQAPPMFFSEHTYTVCYFHAR